MVASTYAKRSLKVIDAESNDGSAEYKRQVHKTLSTTRLRTLSTQMSYRLDEGNGRCTYHIGVEDDGCHSLLDYPAVSESAWILESIARNLNAVVLERKMIQNEVLDLGEGEDGGTFKLADGAPLVVEEPPVLGRGGIEYGSPEIMSEDAKVEKIEDSAAPVDVDKGGKKVKLCTEEGSHTRCELRIQRIETHLLDPSPLSLSTLARQRADSRSTSFSESLDGSVAAMDLSRGRASSIASATVEETAPSESWPNEKDSAGSNNEPVSVHETLSSRNVRVAVVGNVDAGKSTLIGTLTTSRLDDGRGLSRTAIMKHRHEIESGRTSTSSSHLLGFKRSGDVVVGQEKSRNRIKTEDEIAKMSYRVVTLMDLAGHEKYLKTTIHGVSSGMADYGLILVNSRHPPTHMTQQHLNLCCSYGIPVVVVFTKVDGCPDHALANSRKELAKLLKSPEVGKRPFPVRTEADVATCVGKLHALAPTLDVSCVTGSGLDLLRCLLNSLPKRRRHERKVGRPFEFLVEDVFNNVPGVGSVVSGFVNAGELSVGSYVWVGPMNDGTFLRTVAKSAHVARIDTRSVTAGQSACLALTLNKELRRKIRRGMVVTRDLPASTKEFDAEICVLKGEGTTIRKSYQAYVHILNVRQTAYARSIELVDANVAGVPPSHGARIEPEGVVLRPGCRARVTFEFAKRPEYIRPGMRMLFRDGRVRGVGIVTAIPAILQTV